MYNYSKKAISMQKTILTLLFSTLLLSETYAKESYKTETYSMEQLKGTWKFLYEDSDEDTSLVMQGTNTYSLNGTLLSKGNIKIYNSDKILASDTNIIMHDEWSIEDNKLTEQVIECQFDYIKKSKDDFLSMMLNIILKSMCNSQTKVTSTITNISSQEFTTNDDGEIQVYTKIK